MGELQFQLNKTNYADYFEPVYLQYFKPCQLLQIPVILPFVLPVSDGFCATFLVDDNSAATYAFHQVPYSQLAAVASISPQEGEIISVTRSRVEMIFTSADKLKWKTESEISDAFDFLLDQLNTLLTAYLIFTRDINIYRVSKEMLVGVSVYRKTVLPFWDNPIDGVFITHLHVPYSPEMLTQESQQRFMELAYVVKDNENPFVLPVELLLNAERKFRDGFYRDAILDAQTAVESFLNTLFVQLLVSEGKSLDDAVAELENTHFISMVKKQFHGRLGGQWDIPNFSTSPVFKWYQDLYLMRNKVVHAGFQPTYLMAANAIASAKEFEIYIMSLLNSKRHKYPNLERFIMPKQDIGD